MSDYTTLVSTETLARHLADPGWAVFDVRYDLADRGAGRSRYRGGHVPGARFVDVDADLASPPGGGRGRHPLPDVGALAERLAAWGVGPGVQVVAYDDAAGTWAARLWWLLRYLGHDAVAVLDGGLRRWQSEGRPLETDEPPPRRAAAFAASPRPEMIATADEVLAAVGDGSRVLVDSRAPDRFRGENETLDPVGGRIPGARNRFFKLNEGPDGALLAPEALRPQFEAVLEGRPASDAVVYCGSGLTACANLLALEHAGLHGAKLYPGSWSEWCADPARPVERG